MSAGLEPEPEPAMSRSLSASFSQAWKDDECDLVPYPAVANSRVQHQSGSATTGAYAIRLICAAYVTAYACVPTILTSTFPENLALHLENHELLI